MLSHLLHLAPLIAYAALAAFVAGESAGVPLPGETALIAAALLATQDRLSLPVVVAVAAAAAVAGDNLGYLIGRHGVRWLALRRGRLPARRLSLLERSERFFARRGRTAIFFGRWLPSLRVTVALLAGAARMRWRTFVLWNALGACAWAATIGIVVYLLGTAAVRDLRLVGLAAVVAGLVAVVVRVARRRARGCQARRAAVRATAARAATTTGAGSPEYPCRTLRDASVRARPPQAPSTSS